MSFWRSDDSWRPRSIFSLTMVDGVGLIIAPGELTMIGTRDAFRPKVDESLQDREGNLRLLTNETKLWRQLSKQRSELPHFSLLSGTSSG